MALIVAHSLSFTRDQSKSCEITEPELGGRIYQMGSRCSFKTSCEVISQSILFRHRRGASVFRYSMAPRGPRSGKNCLVIRGVCCDATKRDSLSVDLSSNPLYPS